MERHIETLVYTDEIEQDPAYKEHLRYLKNNFLPSEKGQEYNFLVREDGFVVMSNSEFEKNSQWPLYQAVNQTNKDNPDILLIGWGIGLVVPEIYARAENSTITVIEKYPEVIEATPVPDGIDVILKGSEDVTSDDLDGKTFDIIWWDTEEPFDNKEFYEGFLKEDGKLLCWRGQHKIYLNNEQA